MIKKAYESPLALKFHYTLFKLYCKCPANGSEAEKNEQIYSEMYNSDALIDKHDEVQCTPTDDPKYKREKVVTSLMFFFESIVHPIHELVNGFNMGWRLMQFEAHPGVSAGVEEEGCLLCG